MRKPYKVLSEMYSEIKGASTPVKVTGKYIYFIKDDELYQLNPYKMIQPQGMIMTMASNWKKATVMQGEDVRDMYGEVDDIRSWYEVQGAPGDHTFEVYIGS
jgi:hypothetical protein